MKGKKLLFGICCSVAAGMFLPSAAYAKEVTVPVCHVHSGSESANGGCYTKPVYRTETYTYRETHGHRIEESGVCVCGNTGAPGSTCQRIVTKTGTRSVLDRYAIGCGKNDTDVLAMLSLKQNTEEWCRESELQAFYEPLSETFTVEELPYIWNGEAPSDNAVYPVTDNGTYTLQLAGIYSGTKAELTVANIDNTPPVLEEYFLTPKEWTREEIRITVSAAKDVQADGSEGCGLAESPFSWNASEQWGTEGCTVEENADVVLHIRDALGNSREEVIPVRNIDKTPPVVQKMEVTEGINLQSAVITVTAEDKQADGSDGCGLAEQPYSWDGGQTWQEANTHEVKKNGSYTVKVRDRLGNVSEKEAAVGGVDAYGPAVIYENRPSVWTNEPVTVVVSAADRNEDGTDGIGLEENAFSWDEGKTWGQITSYKAVSNGTRTVWVRDAYGNITRQKTKVTNIDKTAPTAVLHAEQKEWIADETKKIVLEVSAIDEESGLAEQPFSWDGGRTWSREGGIEVTKPGTYEAFAKDNAGNTATVSIYLPFVSKPTAPTADIEKPKDTTEKEILTEGTVKQTEREPQKKRDQNIKEKLNWKQRTAKKLQDINMNDVSVIPLHDIHAEDAAEEKPREETAHPETASGIQAGLERFICITGILMFLCLLVFLAWFLFTSAEVYTVNRKGKEIMLGRCMIYRKKDGYLLKLSQKLYEKSETGEFKIVFQTLFADMEKGALLYVKTGKKSVKAVIREEVCICL